MRVPSVNQRVAQLAARLNQEGARAHGWVTDLQVENLLGRRRLAIGTAEAPEYGLQSRPHDWLGERRAGCSATPTCAAPR